MPKTHVVIISQVQTQRSWRKSFLLIFSSAILLWPALACASEIKNEDCLSCHDDQAHGKTFTASVHGTLQCVNCHTTLASVELPHDTSVKRVECGSCHAKQLGEFNESLHGQAMVKGDKLAPHCQSCHGNHDILPVTDKDSKVSALRIPFVCGSCHS